MKALTYLIYILLYEGFVLGGAAYVVFVLDRSGWWLALGILLGSAAYKPEKWIHGDSR